MINFIEHLILGKPLIETVAFKNEDGRLVKVPYAIDQSYKIRSADLPFTSARQFLGLDNNSEQSLRRVLLNAAKKFDLILGESTLKLAREKVNYYSVRRLSNSFRFENDDIISTVVGDIIYGATPSNAISYQMINAITNQKFLKSLSKESILANIKMRTELPEGTPKNYVLAAKLENNVLKQIMEIKRENPDIDENYFRANIQDKEFLASILASCLL